eukprot:6269976-Amphidinium_carterae.1
MMCNDCLVEPLVRDHNIMPSRIHVFKATAFDRRSNRSQRPIQKRGACHASCKAMTSGATLHIYAWHCGSTILKLE